MEKSIGFTGDEEGPPSSPIHTIGGHHLRNIAAVVGIPPLQLLGKTSKPPTRCPKKKGLSKRAQWTSVALDLVVEAIDMEHSFSLVSAVYGIPKSSLRDRMSGKTKSRKMGPRSILSQEEERSLCEYVEDMAHLELPLTPT